jgi:hypothetical protein
MSLAFLMPLIAQTEVALHFETDFESGEGYALGPLASDNWWQFGGELEASIVAPGWDSAQALSFSGADWLWLPMNATAEPVIWIDFYVKPIFVEAAELPQGIDSEQTAVTGYAKTDTLGEVYVVNGDGYGSGQWIASGFLTPLAADGNSATDWIRLTYRLDYFTKRWDLFIDGQLHLHDLGFLDNTATDVAVVADMEAPTLLDYYYAGADLPAHWLMNSGFDPAQDQRSAGAYLKGTPNIAKNRLGIDRTLIDSKGGDGNTVFGPDTESSQGFSSQVAATVAATIFYVSPTGVDVAGGGTSSSPWRSLRYAATQVPVGQAHTIIQGTFNDYMLKLSSSSVVDGNQILSGFTLDGVSRQLNGGVLVERRHGVVMHDVTVQNMRTYGYTVYVTNNDGQGMPPSRNRNQKRRTGG